MDSICLMKSPTKFNFTQPSLLVRSLNLQLEIIFSTVLESAKDSNLYISLLSSNRTYLSDAKIIYIPKLFGFFGTDIIRKHNDYYYDITNIRNKTISIDNKFIERDNLKSRTISS